MAGRRANAAGFAAEDVAEGNDTAVVTIALEAFKVEKYEVQDLGNKLPIGVFHPETGERLQEFTLHPYKTKYDRQLGALLNAPKVKLGTVLGNFLPVMLKSIGGYELEDLARATNLSPQKLVEGMYLADVLTIVLGIRLEAQGPLIGMTAQCPQCGEKNEDNPDKGIPYHDLSSVEVSVVEDLNAKPMVEVTLQDGLEIFGEMVTTVVMRPLRLFQIDEIAKPGSGNPVDINLLYAMVCALPQATHMGTIPEQLKRRGGIFGDDLYDELTMGDLKRLRKALDVIQPGPDMNTDMLCRRCGHEWAASLPWAWYRDYQTFDYPQKASTLLLDVPGDATAVTARTGAILPLLD
jgi:hypothetical protein